MERERIHSKYFLEYCEKKGVTKEQLVAAINALPNQKRSDMMLRWLGFKDGIRYSQRQIGEYYNLSHTMINKFMSQSLDEVKTILAGRKVVGHKLERLFPQIKNPIYYDRFMSVARLLQKDPKSQPFLLQLGIFQDHEYSYEEIVKQTGIPYDQIYRSIQNTVDIVDSLLDNSQPISNKTIRFLASLQDSQINDDFEKIMQTLSLRKQQIFRLFLERTGDESLTFEQIGKSVGLNLANTHDHISRIVRMIRCSVNADGVHLFYINPRISQCFKGIKTKEELDNIFILAHEVLNEKEETIFKLYFDDALYTMQDIIDKLSSLKMDRLTNEHIKRVVVKVKKAMKGEGIIPFNLNSRIKQSLPNLQTLKGLKTDLLKLQSLFISDEFEHLNDVMSNEDKTILILVLSNFNVFEIAELLHMDIATTQTKINTILNNYQSYLRESGRQIVKEI